jgi:hypothetical protein
MNMVDEALLDSVTVLRISSSLTIALCVQDEMRWGNLAAQQEEVTAKVSKRREFCLIIFES